MRKPKLSTTVLRRDRDRALRTARIYLDRGGQTPPFLRHRIRTLNAAIRRAQELRRAAR